MSKPKQDPKDNNIHYEQGWYDCNRHWRHKIQKRIDKLENDLKVCIYPPSIIERIETLKNLIK